MKMSVSYLSRYNTLTLTFPMHRSIHKRSSEWSPKHVLNGVALDPLTSDKNREQDERTNSN